MAWKNPSIGAQGDLSNSLARLLSLEENAVLSNAILNSISAHVAVLNREGIIVAVNEPWIRFALENGIQPGKPVPNTQVGTHYLEVCLRGNDLNLNDEAMSAYLGMRAVLKGDMPHFTIEYPCHSPKEKRWFLLTVTPLGKEGGGLVVSHSNVTERKLAEIRLQESEKLLSAEKNAFESLLFGLNQSAIVAITDMQGNIVFANELFCTISGYSLKELIGSNHRILNSGMHSREFFEDLWSKIGQGQSWNGDICNRKKDGTFYWVDTTITKIIGKGEKPLYMGICYDITARKIAEVQLIHSAKMAVLGEMSAGIAHEINNPLAIISGAVETLSRHIDNPEKLSSKIDTIKRSCLRISKIILGLRRFSRSSERMTLSKRSLTEIVEEAMILTATKARHLNILVTFDGQADAIINCDEIQVEQVLVNLINNAIDAIQNNSEKWVKVSVLAEGPCVILRVMDSGKGVPEDVRAKMFHPFFTTKPVGEGTGLGLSIVKGILDEHKATITILIDSPNTCFEVRFPKWAGELA